MQGVSGLEGWITSNQDFQQSLSQPGSHETAERTFPSILNQTLCCFLSGFPEWMGTFTLRHHYICTPQIPKDLWLFLYYRKFLCLTIDSIRIYIPTDPDRPNASPLPYSCRGIAWGWCGLLNLHHAGLSSATYRRF